MLTMTMEVKEQVDYLRQNHFQNGRAAFQYMQTAMASTAEQDLLVPLQLRGSALERLGGLHGHGHGDDRRVGRHFLCSQRLAFISVAVPTEHGLTTFWVSLRAALSHTRLGWPAACSSDSS